MDPLSRLSFSSDVSEALETMLRSPSWTVVTLAGERGVAVDALNTRGSRRVVAFDQYSCSSV